MLTNEVSEVTRHVYAMSFVQVQALRGAHVVMGVRNVVAGKQVQEEIVNEIPTTKVDAMELDLSSMESVTKFASDFNSSGRSLNLLINNAGIMMTPFLLSKDNIELQFATNHLGHFLLTHLLLDNMKKTARARREETYAWTFILQRCQNYV